MITVAALLVISIYGGAAFFFSHPDSLWSLDDIWKFFSGRFSSGPSCKDETGSESAAFLDAWNRAISRTRAVGAFPLACSDHVRLATVMQEMIQRTNTTLTPERLLHLCVAATNDKWFLQYLGTVVPAFADGCKFAYEKTVAGERVLRFVPERQLKFDGDVPVRQLEVLLAQAVNMPKAPLNRVFLRLLSLLGPCQAATIQRETDRKAAPDCNALLHRADPYPILRDWIAEGMSPQR